MQAAASPYPADFRPSGFLRFVSALLFCALLILQPGPCRQWASLALQDWATAVVPSLLPFMIALPWLTGPAARMAYRHTLGRCMQPLGLSGDTASVAVTGLLAGSPAASAALMYSRIPLTRTQALQLSALSCGAGPVFYMSFAAPLAGGAAWGRLLLLCQWLSGLLLSIMMRRFCHDSAPLSGAEDPRSEPTSPISRAVGQLLHIGGCMVLFGILGQAAVRYLGSCVGIPLQAMLEMTSGVRALSRLPLPRLWRNTLMGGCCCFGGVSILTQSLAHLRPGGLPAAAFVRLRLLHAALDMLLIWMISNILHTVNHISCLSCVLIL